MRFYVGRACSRTIYCRQLWSAIFVFYLNQLFFFFFVTQVKLFFSPYTNGRSACFVLILYFGMAFYMVSLLLKDVCPEKKKFSWSPRKKLIVANGLRNEGWGLITTFKILASWLAILRSWSENVVIPLNDRCCRAHHDLRSLRCRCP